MPVQTSSEALAAQIAALQAQMEAVKAKEEAERRSKEREGRKVLVQASPAKKKMRVESQASISKPTNPAPKLPKPAFQSSSSTASSSKLPARSQPAPSMLTIKPINKPFKPPTQALPGKSNLSDALISHRRGTGDDMQVDEEEDVKVTGKGKAVQRDPETLQIINHLELGPKEFPADSEGGHEWRFVEPNSKIRLRSRVVTHSIVQAHLSQRYLLPAPLLYSLIRPSGVGGGFELDLDGGWVTIAVVSGRGNPGVVKGRVAEDAEDDDQDEVEEREQDLAPKRPKPKKSTSKARHFILLRLTSLSSGGSSSASAGGDALLNLLLFEAESAHMDANGNKVYSGGSGGAYEKWWKMGVGSVLGVIGAKVMKAYGSGNKAPHPLTSPLALTVDSAADIFEIGKSRDLGTCGATKKDGKACEEWVDTRKGQFCEYHVHMAVKKGRGGRAEFTASTGGFDMHARSAPKPGGYDPARKTGLLPRDGARITSQALWNGFAGGQTYMVGGSIVSTNARKEGESLADNLGRGAEERKKRKREKIEGDEELRRLLEREKGVGTTGGKYLAEAEKLNKASKAAVAAVDEKDSKGKDKNGDVDMEETEEERKRKGLKSRVFHSEAIKRIGFDPTTQGEGGLMVEKGEEGRRRLESIALLRAARDKAPKLGSLPGIKTRTSVVRPAGHKTIPAASIAATSKPPDEGEKFVDLSDSE